MKLEEMKKEVEEIKTFLKENKHLGKFKKMFIDRKESLEMAIWKIENQKEYENHKQALEGFVKSGCYGTL